MTATGAFGLVATRPSVVFTTMAASPLGRKEERDGAELSLGNGDGKSSRVKLRRAYSFGRTLQTQRIKKYLNEFLLLTLHPEKGGSDLALTIELLVAVERVCSGTRILVVLRLDF